MLAIAYRPLAFLHDSCETGDGKAGGIVLLVGSDLCLHIMGKCDRCGIDMHFEISLEDLANMCPAVPEAIEVRAQTPRPDGIDLALVDLSYSRPI